jgi:RNA-directed DNA polymerase
LDLDIRAFFDSVPWDLMLKAHHTDERWVLLYLGRWLQAPIQRPDGTLAAREKGTPHGSPISPLIANLFMHYAFDRWMDRNFQGCPFERYADDIIAHCDSEEQAEELKTAIAARLWTLGLELHPDKTKIVYCKDANRRGDSEHTSFDFLGYTFRGRFARGRHGYFVSFSPAMSVTAKKAKSKQIRGWHLNRRIGTDLSGLAGSINPQVRGWINYYGRFYRSTLYFLARRIDEHLVRWAMRKLKRFRRRKGRAWGMARCHTGARPSPVRSLAPDRRHRSACKSRMTGDCHVRFCESRGVRLPPATRHYLRHAGLMARQKEDVVTDTIDRASGAELDSKASLEQLRCC